MSAHPSIDFPWHFEITSIAGREVELAVASDPDGMLIDACERQDAGETGVIDPFWATTWRAASGLDAHLESIDLVGKRVLELGCGTGHAGISAALRGADVTLTDGVDDPLTLVRLSVAKLGAEAFPIAPSIARLRFGLDRIEDTRFDIILGSDVTYLRELWPELDRCCRDHLADDGFVFLADPRRIIATEFRQWLSRTDWRYGETRIDLADDPDHPIRVMRLDRPWSPSGSTRRFP